MKLLEVKDIKQKAKFERGLKKSRSLRPKKDKQFKEEPSERLGVEVQ